MKKQLSEHKNQGFIRLLAALAAVSAVCMVFLDYAGISGNIEFLQGESWILTPWGVVSVPPCWFLYGWLFGTLLVLCSYGIYRLKTRQKRYGMLALWLFLAFWVNMLCYPGSDFLGYMTLIVGGLFAFANIPPAISRAITKGLVSQNSDLEEAQSFSKRQLRRMEWVCFFPLKRALAACIWLTCPIIAIMGSIAFQRESEAGLLGIILLLLTVAALTARKAWRYVTTPCHCVPVLNKAFSKQNIEQLLQGEIFEQFPFADEDLQTYMPVLVSENWIFVEGLLISRKLLLRGTVRRDVVTSGGINRKASRLVFSYLNGIQFQTRNTTLYLDGERCGEMKKALASIPQVPIPLSCAQPSVVEKYNSILPEIQDPKEKLWYLLTHDISDIRQEYEAMFAPNHETHKKKKSQKVAERKG